jgi:ribonuclease-3 family protein
METGVERQGAQELDMQGQYMQELFRMQEVDIKEYSPLALAYIGDAVYELIIRSLVLNEGNRQVQKMHKRTSSMVQASAQARIITALNDRLTEEEHAVYKRGRNAKSMSPAKNQSVSDYHKATGFEALMGYLYLKKEWKRMLELIKAGLDALENEVS